MCLPVVMLFLGVVGQVRVNHLFGVGEEVMLLRVRYELAVSVRVACGWKRIDICKHDFFKLDRNEKKEREGQL